MNSIQRKWAMILKLTIIVIGYLAVNYIQHV